MKLTRVVAIVLVITGLAWAGVHFFYSGLQETLTSAVPSKPVKQPSADIPIPADPPGEKVQEIDYQVIVTRNIFKAEEDAEAVEKEALDEEKLEETTLQLVLLGTVTGMENDARAIIIDKKENKQNLYRIGELVQNAKIRKISRGKVVLEVNGKNEVLVIKDRVGGGPQAPRSPVATSRRQARPAEVENAAREQVQVVRPRRRISLRQPRKVAPAEPEIPDEEEAALEPEDLEIPPEQEELPEDMQPEPPEPVEEAETEDTGTTY